MLTKVNKVNKMSKKNFLYYIDLFSRRSYDVVFNFVNYRYYCYRDTTLLLS